MSVLRTCFPRLYDLQSFHLSVKTTTQSEFRLRLVKLCALLGSNFAAIYGGNRP